MALLGVAAVVVLLVVGGTGTYLTVGVRSDLRASEARLGPPLRHLQDVESDLGSLVTTFLGLLALTDEQAADARSASALVGRAHQGASDAWEAYRDVAVGLPGEAELVEALLPTMGISVEEGEGMLAGNGPVAAGDPAALRARLAFIGVVLDGLRQAETDIDRLIDLYDDAHVEMEQAAIDDLASVLRLTTIVALVAGVPLVGAFWALARRTRRREHESAVVAAARQADADRNEFEARLQRGFDMARTEELTYPVVEVAVGEVAGGHGAELLVADSSNAHLRQVARCGTGSPDSGCPVASPVDCPAVQQGQTQVFPSSRAMDACPHLRDRPEGAVAAVCVPVSIAGKGSGVLHAVSGDDRPVAVEVVERLELIARKVGDRIGMLRAFSRSESQARTDPLTGLLNRRSLEDDVRALGSTDGYVVAYGDLDRFKQLNDLHGHDAGDRALRLFARVLRDGVRPDDLPSRYGGEEFVVVFPSCTVVDATAIVDRLRTRLDEALRRGSVPPFTVSFGVAGADAGDRFADVVERADAALLEAKAAGRDCTVVAGELLPPSPVLPERPSRLPVPGR